MLFIASCTCRRGPRGTLSVSLISVLRGGGISARVPNQSFGQLARCGLAVSGSGGYGCRSVLPNLPRAPAGGPQLFQKHLVAQSIHALPETAVAVCAQLPFLRQPLHRFALPNRSVAFNVINHFRLKHEEAAVDQIGRASCRERV